MRKDNQLQGDNEELVTDVDGEDIVIIQPSETRQEVLTWQATLMIT